ncbi:MULTISPECIES: type I glutamate--ammonia ligase [unclassified Lactobacillus]|uniref:type I glutamate--ammonia ligase n=1 Tax=unclassified Lactobacillus TaxID=2620435 RepID=UPI000EFBABA4|nr:MULTISPECIES: type I glutamate--ammonia ligase [unclassified Lactobacillus]RMC39117.1 type I glutamate--ammonia ligase [Lactobacillus sp. ESL0237]RMC43400.1 type I glutamate--ammonia ligase [Lactobacillus sp. ESL0234]RMC44312.1 type I glutamate--ammonia ligase [Lactobacillus sp. ESL0236]RMC46749.1 type I glutamate--ammonia ligase [Lactobacillus sp. ESL0230]RMC49412.1 type I glutamate--ammonia ligase [Lactobacillus sp. ESL0225]
MTNKISEDDIRKSVADNDVRFLRLMFTDINGTLKAVEVPNSQLEKVLENDIRFDGSSIDGFVRLEESDMVLYPDFSTWSVLPWTDSRGGKIGSLICSVHTTDGQPFTGDPRNNLKRVLNEMKEMGFSAFDIGFEAEFHLLKLDSNGNWTTEVPDHASYFDLTSNDESASCRRDIVETLESIGFEVEAAHHEVGVGQQEIDFKFDDALTTADRVQMFKMIVREIAKKHGLYATFMAKPLQGEAGNGMHTNMSLFKGNKNAFYDNNNKFHLSNTALYFLNGILEHARAITAVGNPTVNSYKRLIPGYEAPVYISWASKNRSPMVRVPSAEEINTRLEMRSADPTANPYLLLAACLSAGLSGIKAEKMPMDPVDCNLFELSQQQRDELGIKPLPSTLHNALKAFKDDQLIQAALGDHLTQSFISSKELEWSQYTQTVSDWERNRYMGY